MARVVLYLTEYCSYCHRAERLLETKGVTDIERIRVDLHPERQREMMEKVGRRTVPQIWIGQRHVGGYDELAALERAGRLDALLATAD